MGEKFGEHRPGSKAENGQTRREFLRTLGLAAGAAAFFGVVKTLEKTGKVQSLPEEEKGPRVDMTIRKEQIYESSDEWEEVKLSNEDKEAAENILYPSLDKPLKINKETIELLTKYWINVYQHQRNAELRKNYAEIEDFNRRREAEGQPTLLDIFRMHGVPEEYSYIAITESNWRMNARSKKGASGPYQFIRSTAKEYGLHDPTDPIASAHAAARKLSDLYKQTKDWKLSLSAYNGIAGYYITECRDKGIDPSYEKYWGFLEKRINKKREDINKLTRYSYFSHTVREEDTLLGISHQYRIPVEILKKTNHMRRIFGNRKQKKTDQLYIGQKILIPFTKYSRQRKFEEEVAGTIENLSYAIKVEAAGEALGIKKAQYVAGREMPEEKNL